MKISFHALLLLLFTGIAGNAFAEGKFVLKPPLQRQLEALVLPEVRFGDTDLADALLYLQKKARTSPQGATPVPFVVHLPADFKPRHELSLDLKSIPFWEALHHLCGQAGVGFSIERGAIAIRPLKSVTAAPAPVAVRTEMPAPDGGWSGRLGKPAQPLVSGQGVHRSISGEVQPEKSGTGKRRNLNGWPIDVDPRGAMSMNCVDRAKCQAKCCEDGACGCHACTCHNLKVNK